MKMSGWEGAGQLVSWTKRAARGGGWGQSIQPYSELSGTIQYQREKQQLSSTAGIPPPVLLYQSLGRGWCFSLM